MSAAALPLIAGISGGAIAQIGLGFDRTMVVSGVLAVIGEAIAWISIDNSILEHEPDRRPETEWNTIVRAVRFIRCRVR